MKKYPYQINMITGAFTMGMGDIAAQRLIEEQESINKGIILNSSPTLTWLMVCL